MPRINLLTLLALCGILSFASAEENPNFKKDVVYGKAGDVELKLDLATPASGDGPFPCVVCIHGGAWRAGNKATYDGLIQSLSKQGYVAATVGYRFCPQCKFPGQIEDVKCAVRYLREHAKELKIDTEKFGAFGESAGGHLSLLLGLMNKEDGMEGTSGSANQSSKVQAIVNYFGPTDFTLPGTYSEMARGLVKDFTGTDDVNAEAIKKASPVTYIDKTDPPVLTFHGSEDPLVPVSQARRLHELLREKGVTEKLIVVDGAGHGWGGETRDKTMKQTVEFFDKNLKK